MAKRKHLLFLLLLSGCTVQNLETSQNNPLVRKFTWFSYLNGDDIRKNCFVGSPDQFRFVYNGIYNEQVRAFDIRPAEEPNRYLLEANVTGEANLLSFDADLATFDFFEPWRPVSSVTNLPPRDISLLRRAVDSDFSRLDRTKSIELPSISFYWTASVCANGEFRLGAFKWPGKSFKELSFAKLLAAWDFTGVPVNEPRDATLFEIFGSNELEDHHNYFKLKFNRDRLR